MRPRIFPGLLNNIADRVRGVGLPREVEREIYDYFEEASLGRGITSYRSEEYNIEAALEDYVNFVYCALLLQYHSSMNIEVEDFIGDLLKLKTCVTSKIQSTCSSPLLNQKIMEFNKEYLTDIQILAEEIYENCDQSVNRIAKLYRRKNNQLLRECDTDLPFRENSLSNKKLAISCLWTLFSSRKALKLTRDKRRKKDKVPVYQ